MDCDLKKIRKITKFMRENGILELKTAGIELSLSPHSLFPVEHQVKAEEPTTPIVTDSFTSDDILMWSAPGYIPKESSNA